jgi:hypothetical protein
VASGQKYVILIKFIVKLIWSTRFDVWWKNSEWEAGVEMTTDVTSIAFFVKLITRILGFVLTGILFLDLHFVSVHLWSPHNTFWWSSTLLYVKQPKMQAFLSETFAVIKFKLHLWRCYLKRYVVCFESINRISLRIIWTLWVSFTLPSCCT